jgi:hypothetical protein
VFTGPLPSDTSYNILGLVTASKSQIQKGCKFVLHCTALFLFQNSKDPLMNQIYDKLVAPYEDSLPVDDIEGLRRLCSIRNYALAAHTFNLINVGYIPNCSITVVPEAFFPATIAVALSENSPYKEVFNQM